MIFETALADALFVNWAVPAGAVPRPPAPLELETVLAGGERLAFVTLVLFRQRGLRVAALPWPRLSFPQCNLRLPVRDAEGGAGVWLLRELVPAWVVPLARTIGRQPVTAAVFDLRAGAAPGEQRWTLHAGRQLVLAARPGSGGGLEPRLGDWPTTVAFFRDRPRAWVGRASDPGSDVRRIETAHPAVEGVPMAAGLERADWLAARLPAVDPGLWSRPHSAFRVAAARMTFELARAPLAALPARAPVPG